MADENLANVLKGLRTTLAAEAAREVPDVELLERYVREGDEVAFTALVHRHGGMVLGVCRHRLRSLQDAEDACQAVFLILARKAASIRQRESLASWLHGVAYRVARDQAARVARRDAHVASGSDGVVADVADEVSWREFQAIVDEEFRSLPDQFRAPLVLCYLEGKTRDEAARQLGCPLPTLRGRLERGRELLRSRLLRRGLVTSLALLATFEAGSAAAGTMPVTLFLSTTRSALAFAAGQGVASGLISAAVAEITTTVLRGMFMTKLKFAAAACAAIVVTGFGTSAGIYHAVAGGQREVVVAQAPAPPAPVADPAPAVPAPAPQAIKPPKDAPPTVALPARPVGPRPLVRPVTRLNGIAFPSVAETVLHADAIVVGKVVKIEDKDQDGHKVAVIKIEESLKGARGLTSLRVGFTPALAPLAAPAILPPPNGVQVARPHVMVNNRRPVTLTLGEEACFTLKRHDKGDFYVLAQTSGTTSALEKTAPNHDATMQLVRRVARFIETPLATNLTSKDASDRLLAAGMLILQYRTRPTPAGPVQEEPIAAAESKLILAAFAEADLNAVEPHLGTTPLNLFLRVGLTEKDGWKPARPNGGAVVVPRVKVPVPPAAPAVMPPTDYTVHRVDEVNVPGPVKPSAEAAKSWLKANADTYRIKRFVALKNDPVPSVGK